ncbi:MAG: type III secretion system export apparatus subunit SctV [Acidobacteria bacterium]|nr:type III secretion system export apparatus subunit SctV [Acidobacteriota bacterium]
MGFDVKASLDGIIADFKEGNVSELLTKYGDIALAVMVVMIIGMMIIPLPTFLLDILLTLNITIAVTLLLVSMYIPDATRLASFPTILLITTLFRLALNVSTTRLILLQADAGEVIEAFGNFVVAGNLVVGGVIFLILTLIQFIVIAKGSERVAEVAARFTLDAMPGKQMSIDADLRAGAFDISEARRRRQAIQRESQLYGSMDGAMKFVKGDAIAGIIITMINIIGGLIIGTMMRGMPVGEAAATYSLLTIGDGLVSQIPALLMSVTAGMVTTRVSSEDESSHLAKDIGSQLIAQPKAFAISAGILIALGTVPGLPTIPFYILALGSGGLSYALFRTQRLMEGGPAVKQLPGKKGEKELPEGKDKPALPGQQQKRSDDLFSLTVPMSLELSKEITAAMRSQEGEEDRFVQELLPALRQAMYLEMGIRYPGVQVKANAPLPPWAFLIRLKEVPVTTAAVKEGHVLVNDSPGNLSIFSIPGEDAKNPATGKPASWVETKFKDRLLQAGIRVWDLPEILMLNMSGFEKKYAAEFLDLQEVQILLDKLAQAFPTLVQEVVPKVVSLHTVTDVLQRLVQEEVSIHDLRTILQALSEWGRLEKDPVMLAEYVRSSLKRYISYKHAEGKNTLMVHLLDPEIEDMIASSIQRTSTGNYLALDPESSQDILFTFRQEFAHLPPTAQRPVIITDMEIRRYVRRLLEMDFEQVVVLSYQELSPELNIQPLGRISLKRRS